MIIIVPDIHGRSFWKKLLDEKIDPNTTIVFLGDYVDPYPRDKVTVQEAIDGLKEVIEFKKKNSNVILLLGNHDGQYINLSKTVSRFSFDRAHEIFNIFYDNKDLFQLAYMEDNVLFTHSGVTKTWLNAHGLINYNPTNMVAYLNSFTKYISDEWIMEMNPYETCMSDGVPIREVGEARGGYDRSGSPIWADVRELALAPAYVGICYQICGHTQLLDTGSFVHRDNFWMVDSREIFKYENNNVSIYK